MTIYTRNSALTPLEIEILKESAETQNELIYELLKADPNSGYAIWEVIEITGLNANSVNRALSSMSSQSGRAAKKFRDANGEMPLVKRKDITSTNPETGKTCCTYWYNKKYKKEI